MKRIFTLAFVLGLAGSVLAQDRWTIMADKPVINMSAETQKLPHSDHVEMSGDRMAVVLYWSLDSNSTFGLNRTRIPDASHCPQ